MPVERSELEPPTIEDFYIVKESFLGLAHEPGANVRALPKEYGLYIGLERLYADLDFLVWPLLGVSVTGKIRTYPGGNSLTLRYRQLALNDKTINSSVNHDYLLRVEDGELETFAHAMSAAPLLPEPRQDREISDEHLDQADAGARILRVQTGMQLELTTGDCGVLFDRLMDMQ